MGGLFDLPGIYNSIGMPLPHMHSLCSVNHGIPGTGVGHNNRSCESIQSGANVTWDTTWLSQGGGELLQLTLGFIPSFLYRILKIYQFSLLTLLVE